MVCFIVKMHKSMTSRLILRYFSYYYYFDSISASAANRESVRKNGRRIITIPFPRVHRCGQLQFRAFVLRTWEKKWRVVVLELIICCGIYNYANCMPAEIGSAKQCNVQQITFFFRDLVIVDACSEMKSFTSKYLHVSGDPIGW